MHLATHASSNYQILQQKYTKPTQS